MTFQAFIAQGDRSSAAVDAIRRTAAGSVQRAANTTAPSVTIPIVGRSLVIMVLFKVGENGGRRWEEALARPTSTRRAGKPSVIASGVRLGRIV